MWADAIGTMQNWDKESRVIAKATGNFRRLGMQLVQERQAAVVAEKSSNPDGVGGEALKKKGARDLLSLLIRANMADDVPPQQRLSVTQILNQIPTFLAAGMLLVF